MQRLALLALVALGGCTLDSMTGSPDPASTDASGDYTVHRDTVGYEACPPYQEPVDFLLSIASACAGSPVTSSSCEPITTTAAGSFEFELDERWNGDASLPTDYPPYVIVPVHYTLDLDNNVLTGTADGSYSYDTPTTGGDCAYTWNVTATQN